MASRETRARLLKQVLMLQYRHSFGVGGATPVNRHASAIYRKRTLNPQGFRVYDGDATIAVAPPAFCCRSRLHHYIYCSASSISPKRATVSSSIITIAP